MCLNAYTYLLRIYVLFELFTLALLRITALHCVSSSFEQSHRMNICDEQLSIFRHCKE